MLNQTSLLSTRTQAQIKSAMKACVRASFVGAYSTRYIKNSKGNTYLRVSHTRGIGGGFYFWTHNSKNVTNDVKKALQLSVA